MIDFLPRVYRNGRIVVCCLVVTSSVLLVACKQKPELLPPLPEGPQVMTGTLLPAELSLSRRGTHVLRIEGEDTFFVESSKVSLRSYENQLVTLKGLLERNTDDVSLPVLNVDEVLHIQTKTTKEWVLRSLGLKLKAPELWNGKVFIDNTDFYIPDNESPIVTVAFEKLEELPQGPSIVLGTKRAVRTLNEVTGSQKVTLPYRDSYLVFSLNPTSVTTAGMLREDWLAMLQSVEFDIEKEVPSTSATGSALHTPCGGPAGILCPAGFYCDITHIEENIGVCVGI